VSHRYYGFYSPLKVDKFSQQKKISSYRGQLFLTDVGVYLFYRVGIWWLGVLWLWNKIKLNLRKPHRPPRAYWMRGDKETIVLDILELFLVGLTWHMWFINNIELNHMCRCHLSDNKHVFDQKCQCCKSILMPKKIQNTISSHS